MDIYDPTNVCVKNIDSWAANIIYIVALGGGFNFTRLLTKKNTLKFVKIIISTFLLNFIMEMSLIFLHVKGPKKGYIVSE